MVPVDTPKRGPSQGELTNLEAWSETARNLAAGLLAYDAVQSRLLLKLLRALAEGRPITADQVDRMAAEVGMAPGGARGFLQDKAERDVQNAIVGVAGLSLMKHPHRLTVDGTRLSAWCALDALFLPSLLGREAVVISRDPVSRKGIRLRVTPDRIKEISPPSAVTSLVLLDLDRGRPGSVQATWDLFCRHVHFFAGREQAERWAAGRSGIAILTVEQAFKVGQDLWSRVLATAD